MHIHEICLRKKLTHFTNLYEADVTGYDNVSSGERHTINRADITEILPQTDRYIRSRL